MRDEMDFETGAIRADQHEKESTTEITNLVTSDVLGYETSSCLLDLQ
jgi:hypothetical protein